MTTPVVSFVYADWVGAFPVFSGVSSGLATGFFNRASLIFANASSNPAFSDGNMTMLMYLLTAHIAWLNAPRDAKGNPATTGTPPPPLVGRINTASEGSVTVGAEWDSGGSASPTQAWYLQSQWGAEFWAATAQYRTARGVMNMTSRVPSAIFPSRWGR